MKVKPIERMICAAWARQLTTTWSWFNYGARNKNWIHEFISIDWSFKEYILLLPVLEAESG
jgi:hypothetical protein